MRGRLRQILDKCQDKNTDLNAARNAHKNRHQNTAGTQYRTLYGNADRNPHWKAYRNPAGDLREIRHKKLCRMTDSRLEFSTFLLLFMLLK